MELLEFVCVMTVILMAGFLLYLKMASQNALKMQELAQKAQLSKIRQDSAMQRYGKGQAPEMELGAWVTELAQTAGFDVSNLFSDEIPPEIAKLIPLAKGFLEGGGLQKLLGGAAGGTDEITRRSI